jgi:hypothetical protein
VVPLVSLVHIWHLELTEHFTQREMTTLDAKEKVTCFQEKIMKCGKLANFASFFLTLMQCAQWDKEIVRILLKIWEMIHHCPSS